MLPTTAAILKGSWGGQPFYLILFRKRFFFIIHIISQDVSSIQMAFFSFFSIKHTVHSPNTCNTKFGIHWNGRCYTVKPVLSGHSKIDKTKVLKTNGSLMKVESIAECSLGVFCNTFDLH